MKQYLFTTILVLITALTQAQYSMQTKYFVYLQTEPAQPFYIKIDGQVISANSSGYLILPQLKTGDYKLTVGFPGTKIPEQYFNFVIDYKDKGYLIKDFGADGWGLFDLQTMQVQKTVAATAMAPVPAKKQPAAPAENVSDFTKVLSKAANDPTLLEKPKPEPVPEKPKPVQPAPSPVATNPVPSPAIPANPDGIELMYTDRDEDGHSEPVKITIPVTRKAEKPAEPGLPAAGTRPVQQQPAPALPLKATAPTPVPEAAPIVASNARCRQVATEADFIKLKKEMASQLTDDKMVAKAVPAFTAKCYTTAQVKYLSNMFVSNAGKYNFYAAVKPHVTDPENFRTLYAEMDDTYYVNKFNLL